jgi:hypothetical protein
MPDIRADKFLLEKNKGSLTTTLKEIIAFVNSNLPVNTSLENRIFKVKVVVTELLNNAIKHVKNSETTIHVLIDGENITIKKTDNGSRFRINKDLLFSDGMQGRKVQLCSDAFHSVYAIFESEDRIKFSCEDKSTNDLTDFKDLMEHFGLLIITKAAHLFTYEYDRRTGLNTFTVLIPINK